jgi:hypothetical protein
MNTIKNIIGWARFTWAMGRAVSRASNKGAR